MKRCLIDGNEIKSKAQLQDKLAYSLGFPEWYGGNFDAFHDCLSDIKEETVITVINYSELSANIGKNAQLLIKVICDCAKENENIKLNKY